MPRKEHKSTSTVISGLLYTDDPATTGARVGSAQWFAWLETASVFYYDGSGGRTFTARAERRARGGVYWIAYRQIDGKLRKRYLGKAAALTAERLADVARRLSE